MIVVVTDNKICYSVYLSDDKILHTTFFGVVNHMLMKQHMQNVVKFARNNKIAGALIDFRKLRGSYFKLFDYLKKEIYPKLQLTGFNIQAFIISDDLLTANVTKKLVDVLNELNGNVKLFTNFEEAKKWVIQMIKS